ncbi:3-keto-5-aminohexanoate cleavage protein [Ruegeria sp. Ofav3-42]|uniref:3-keto-5-aminohexanoate cleavage protein n=1 Tax=Ruegeria sp. Ofav3-42 TaxID=2917759 RepID=UPI001EF5CA0C|nr:3-keto-5-aminohexanoate cleavage protein [Ruegeria sp. Ofav3-42]MCG7518482.1 3-keto-5-aminohexanoate cleavage protein [Ruegeria sp. Ofav3-42]
MSETQTPPKPYILVAPNGARRGHADHAKLPVSLQEIVDTAQSCFEAGAHGIHLHVRDQQGQHTLDAGRYLETIAELRRVVPDMDIQITTEAAGIFDVPAQLACLQQVQPQWASISVREVARAPELAAKVYDLCAEQGTRVQHILYDAEDAGLLAQWESSGTVQGGQTDRLLVLGRYTSGQESKSEDLDQFPQDSSRWMICAFGKQEHACLQLAAARGGDLRVGFENSMIDSNGNIWANNAASVSALVAALKGAIA